jgi:sugar phosphate isomerase/epimerase
VGVHSAQEQVRHARELLEQHHLAVSMATGDSAIVYNNDRGPACLRNITPYLDLATALGAPLIRVALKSTDDIAWAQRAADEAATRGLRLAHQCHTQSLFETVDSIERTLTAINRPNFGLIYEPANLELCGQPYGASTLARLAPWIFNVYLQNQRLTPTGAMMLETWCRGPVSFDLLPIYAPGGLDFAAIVQDLNTIKYQGWITVHQSAVAGTPVATSALQTADFLRTLLAR